MKKMAFGLIVLFGLIWVKLSPAADFNGDGTNDLGYFRSENGFWKIKDLTQFYFGASTDNPLPGDYNGDGTVDIAYFRPTTGLWKVRGLTQLYFGRSTDTPLIGVSGGKGPWGMNGSTVYYTGGSVAINTQTAASTLTVFGGNSVVQSVNPLSGTGYSDGFIFGIGSVLDAYVWNYEDGYLSFGTNNQTRMFIDNDGYIGIGTTSPDNRLDVKTNASEEYAASLFNDGNASNRYGLQVQCGSNTGVGTNYLVDFRDGDGTVIGSITFTGSNVAYNNFTAEHTAKIPEKDNGEGYPYGTVLRLEEIISRPELRQAQYLVRPSDKAYDTAVFGVYAGKSERAENLHSVYAIGDGHILVTSEGGDIRNGDYLTTSNHRGCAMRQADDLRHSYTVAKALEAATWEPGEAGIKLIPCTYQTQ